MKENTALATAQIQAPVSDWMTSPSIKIVNGIVVQNSARDIAGISLAPYANNAEEIISISAEVSPVGPEGVNSWIGVGFARSASQPFGSNGLLWVMIRRTGKYSIFGNGKSQKLGKGEVPDFNNKDFTRVELQYDRKHRAAQILINGSTVTIPEWAPVDLEEEPAFGGFQLYKGSLGKARLKDFSIQTIASEKGMHWAADTFSGNGSLNNKITQRGNLRWRASQDTLFANGYVLQEGRRHIAGLPLHQMLERAPEVIRVKADLKPIASEEEKGWMAIGFSNTADRPFWNCGLLWMRLTPSGKFVLLKDGTKEVLLSGVVASFQPETFNQVELQYRRDEPAVRLLINNEVAGEKEWISVGEIADFRFASFQLQKGLPGSAALRNFEVGNLKPKLTRSTSIQVISTSNGQPVQQGETIDLGFATSKNDVGIPEIKSRIFSIRNQTDADICLSNFRVSQENVFDLVEPSIDTPPSPCNGSTLIKFVGAINLEVTGESTSPRVQPYIGRVSWNGTNNGSFNFNVKLRVLKDKPALRLTTDTGTVLSDQSVFPFESISINQPFIQRFFIYNDGDQPLTISSFRVEGEAFTSILIPSTSILPGQSTPFEIRLQSNTNGNKTGTLSFSTNDPSNRTFRLNLTAQVGTNAVGPQIRVTTAAGSVIANGGEAPGFTSDTPRRTFAIINDGDQALENVRVTISGNAFTLESPPPATIQNRADFSIRWNGNASTTAEVSIASNDPDDNPFRFSVRSQVNPPSGQPDIAVTLDGLEISNGDLVQYGETLINIPLKKNISVRNKGTGILRINQIEINSSGFGATSSSDPITIPARETRNVIQVSLNSAVPIEAEVIFLLHTNVGLFELTLRGSVVMPQPCEPSDTALCFYEGRFKATLEWRRSPNGQWLDAKAQPLTNQTGAFYYHNPKNLEMLLKILDGRTINGSFWVFYGVLTDQEIRLTIKDIFTNRTKTFTKAKGNLCGNALIGAFPNDGMTTNTAGNENGTTNPGQKIKNLKLLDSRFEVKIDWHNPRNGSSGSGFIEPYTDNSGFFWFFKPSNIEVTVKVLDANAVNGHFWVFHGPMTDLEYTLTVTDTATNRVKTYHKAFGTLCGGHDIEAFLI